MARDGKIELPRGAVTQLTNSDATEVTFQVLSGSGFYVHATADTTPPAIADFGLLYRHGEGEANRPLTELFPGTASVVRLWAYSPAGGTAYISHA